MAALFIGSIVLTATLGLTCGINKLMHRHCFNKDNKRRDDLGPSFAALIHINGSAALPEYLAGPGALTILSSANSANESAVFSWGQHGDSAEGVLRGFPAAGKAGLMGGSFSVQVPGLEKPVAGTWISVDRTDKSADEETTAKFDAMVKIVEEGKLDEETLEKIFGMGL
ncbi:hypothetical protein LTR35_014565 [Friedmanniomyces endolithicus]|uniref:Uncharacterized protein n=1 Tax=Friedmanniomyces endolithicus TaxID=329885 RepID=A0AAN6FDX2_9PEZI|nr:hypothetical protein LTR35_014565 [Friedmanniomyces endolithicus]KAK0274792.1 hypothetical protein LTS00_015288 [Friedmanniomyces endolithicus]KAK0316100.1 hypothetical protein LTR82_012393 [Friedmanniomyces endolithicus]KAK0985634.1 hypothetical protein LTR54_013711 [Friedmanniomyces endolithicus]